MASPPTKGFLLSEMPRSPDVPKNIGKVDVGEIYDAQGCDHCMHTGYSGRVAIYELTNISNAMRDAIHEGKGLPAMRRLARKEKMVSLRRDGARHVATGLTTVEEVLRVSTEEMAVAEA